MLDFIYDRPNVDFCFVTENQFDIFKRNDTFQSALVQMDVELPGKNIWLEVKTLIILLTPNSTNKVIYFRVAGQFLTYKRFKLLFINLSL